MEALNNFLDPRNIWVAVPVVAILGYFINKGLQNFYRHQERMEKIRAGIDPDEE